MQIPYNVLWYKIQLYFQDYKLAIEIDENGYSNKYWLQNKKIKNSKTRIWMQVLILTKKAFDVFRAINEIFRHTK